MQRLFLPAVILKKNGKMLFLRRSKKEGLSNKQFYRGLGGKAEQGESPLDCVVREIKEEAGIDIEPIWKGVATFSNNSDNDWEAHIFISEGFKGELMEKSPEGDLIWVDEGDIQNLEMPEGDKKILPFLFKEGKFHAHVIYDDYKNLVDLKIGDL